jgi:cobalt-zinc-cadmium resistance protein CzcA
VIVGGLIANLIIGVFLLPTLYIWLARETDELPAGETSEDF